MSVAGGARVVEPAVDLGVALAVASSLRNRGLPPDLVAFGELGLAGEVRSCGATERRLAEASRRGFRRAIVARAGASAGAAAPVPMLEMTPVATIGEAIEAAGL